MRYTAANEMADVWFVNTKEKRMKWRRERNGKRERKCDNNNKSRNN
jgi:hypothetical protein